MDSSNFSTNLALRAVACAARVGHAASRLASGAANEILWRVSTPASREAANRDFYAADRAYFPDGGFFRDGFFGWERRAVASFPASGHIAVFSAGCGREVRALRELGYRVTALEPNPALFQAGRDHFRGDPAVKFVRSSFADFVRDGFADEIAGVILGWGGVSYLLEDEARAAFFRALRDAAPRAPVLLSFLIHPRPWGWPARLRAAIAGPGPLRVYLPKAGFVFLYTPEILATTAAAAGYRPVYTEIDPYPHALWVPDA